MPQIKIYVNDKQLLAFQEKCAAIRKQFPGYVGLPDEQVLLAALNAVHELARRQKEQDERRVVVEQNSSGPQLVTDSAVVSQEQASE